jgi:hypothetical protein
MTVRYAVLLKVHYWDAFVERRFQHLLRQVGAGDVYVFVDETHGKVGEIPHDRVIRATEADVEGLGLLAYPSGRVFWYNADYPLYFLRRQNPTYDYVLMCEYDTVFNVAIEDFVNAAAQRQVDYVGTPLGNDAHWTETCDGVYPDSVILHNWLNAISLHSGRSVDFLLQRRQSLTGSYKEGRISNWPYSEPFIATEMHTNDFVVSKLSDFGKVDNYNWWPPSHEKDLPLLQDQDFLHPVLDERKYVTSCLRYARLYSYFVPNGQLRRLLDRSSSSLLSMAPAFVSEIKHRLRRRRAFLTNTFDPLNDV